METFEQYVCELESLAVKACRSQLSQAEVRRVQAALDGGPGDALRRTTELAERREQGAFFTGRDLADRALQNHVASLKRSATVLDPACGAGDLLLACTTRLSCCRDLRTTLVQWGKQLAGYDINAEFVRAAKARLILAAVSRGAKRGRSPIPPIDSVFPHVCVGDGLSQPEAIYGSQAIAMNPPYSMIDAPEGCAWGSGKVSMAALFLEACVFQAEKGTAIVAILPDVLRAGSRYEKWRNRILGRARISKIEIVGQFDRHADVDVFLLSLKVNECGGRDKKTWYPSEERPRHGTVGDFFDVHVGPVVPYRDPHRGPWYPYIYPKLIPAWKTVSDVSGHRRYRGRVFKPPFVVVRRTSRPGDRHRAAGSIIRAPQEVAVENHFLVLQPKDAKRQSCRGLIEVLRSPAATRWLNMRIRCRHLTVSALRDMPWFPAGGTRA